MATTTTTARCARILPTGQQCRGTLRSPASIRRTMSEACARAAGRTVVQPSQQEPPPTARTIDVPAALRQAYERLRPAPGEPVMLSALRPEIDRITGGTATRQAVDDAIDGLFDDPNARISGEVDQKWLTDADRAAEVVIGGQRRHMILIY